jgi:hypothetical protein
MLKMSVRNEVSPGVLRNRFFLRMKLFQWVIISLCFDANKYHDLQREQIVHGGSVAL